MSQKCVVSQCCCGCSLRCGSLTTGILCLLSAIYSLVAYILILSSGSYVDSTAGAWYGIIVSVLALAVAIILLVGITKNNVKLIKFWVYFEIVIVILTLIGTIVAIIMVSAWAAFLVIGLVEFLDIYLIIVVWSYAVKLETPVNTIIFTTTAAQSPSGDKRF